MPSWGMYVRKGLTIGELIAIGFLLRPKHSRFFVSENHYLEPYKGPVLPEFTIRPKDSRFFVSENHYLEPYKGPVLPEFTIDWSLIFCEGVNCVPVNIKGA